MIFLVNIAVIAVSRTAFIVAPVLLLVLAFVAFGWRGVGALLAVLAVAVALIWPLAPSLQRRTVGLLDEVRQYQLNRGDARKTSAGERLEFWTKSLGFVAASPLIGHGTGSVTEQFRRAAEASAGSKTVGALVSSNPHNQTLMVAVQLGLVGTLALWAMWMAHLLLFRGSGLLAWTGFVIVAQNILGSLFNSHLSDFTHGWVYVIGVGMAGGLMLQARAHQARAHQALAHRASGTG